MLISGLLMSGCASGPGSSSSGAGRGGEIGEVVLFAVPVAVELDDKPGPDGIAVRVYASAVGKARGIPIRSGTLEIQMFDGVLKPGEPISQAPRRSWKFKADQLRSIASTSQLGVGYRFALAWQDTPPAGSHVSVLARYLPPKGAPLQSPPSGISITGH
ncbi:MAG TPA: hypothetical protein DCM86_18805 [Verrucomicrobiales bacterium]|nr:hypothetical protein [Verrucomicrobiales bacterium]